MIKTLLISSLASLVFLLPSHGHSREGGTILDYSASSTTSLEMPSLEPQTALETALHPLSSGLLNLFSFGNCTAFVASRLPIPSNWGNALDWGTHAQAEGYTISSIPKVGAIAWNTTDSYLGHVAVVIAVSNGVPTIQEANYTGFNLVDERIPKPGEFNYIYF